MMFTNETSDAINTSQKGVYVYMCEGTNICYECGFRMRRVTLLIHLRRVSMCKRARVLTYVPIVCRRVFISVNAFNIFIRILTRILAKIPKSHLTTDYVKKTSVEKFVLFCCRMTIDI